VFDMFSSIKLYSFSMMICVLISMQLFQLCSEHVFRPDLVLSVELSCDSKVHFRSPNKMSC